MTTITEIINEKEYTVLLADEGKTIVGVKNNFDYGGKVILGLLANGKPETQKNYKEELITEQNIM